MKKIEQTEIFSKGKGFHELRKNMRLDNDASTMTMTTTTLMTQIAWKDSTSIN